MRAAIYRSYGPPEVLEIRDVAQPTIRDENRVLIRVHYASVNPYDCWFRKDYLPVRFSNGMTRPKANDILGVERCSAARL